MAAVRKPGIPWNEKISLREHGGVQIYMLKEEPGTYYDAQGREVDPSIAAAAGFPIEDQIRERVTKERLSEAEKRIRREVHFEQLKIAREDSPPFFSEHVGAGKFVVRAADTGEAVREFPRSDPAARANAEAEALAMSEALWMREAGFSAAEIAAKQSGAGSAAAAGGAESTSSGDPNPSEGD